MDCFCFLALSRRAKIRRKLHLLKLVSETLKFQGRTNTIHHFDGTGKHMECHRALWLYLLTTDKRNGRLRTIAYHSLEISCFPAIERKSKDMLHDMLIHVIEPLSTIIALIRSAHTCLPIRIPTMRYSQSEIACPCYRHCRIVGNLPHGIGHILGSKHIPMLCDIIRCQQCSTEHTT